MSEFVDKNYRNRCSEKTLQTNNNGFFMDFVNLVKETAGETWIQKKFGQLKTDNERIRSIYDSEETKHIVLKLLSNVREVYRKKDGTISILRRLEAESAFESGDLNKSLLLYSQSVLRAPKTGECNNYDSGLTLSLALWGRCKLLIALHEYSLALTDVQQALKEHLPTVFKAEAYWKMAICYKALKEDKKSKVAFDLAEKMLESNERIEELKKDREMIIQYLEKKDIKSLPTLDSVYHEQFPCASKKLTVKSAENLGRFVVANEQIKTGETLVVEPPYAACLLPEMFGTHCHHCFARLRAPIGCPDCANVAFCKPACRDAALSSYHVHECRYLDLLIGSGMSILSHTALRMITQQSLEKCLEMYKNRSKEKVFSLCTNSEKREAGDFLQRSLMAGFLLRCLQKCGYFSTNGGNVVPSDEEFVIGELLLFNLQMLQFNAHEIFEQVTTSDRNLEGSKLSYIGVGIYPTVALFNHDCYPAVTRYFVGRDIIIKALRPLQPNDVVAENYGPIFSRKLLQDRQRSLSSRYWFQCQCNACTSNWPLMDGLENVDKRVRCTSHNCTSVFTLPLSNNSAACPKCKKNVKLDESIKLLNWCEEQYEIGFEFMKNTELCNAIKVFCEAINVFHRISCPPHRTTHLAQESLQLCLSSFGNSSNTLTKK
ncbi:unnamed protein product [Psylliodes chrysocephalus]|uniref:SET domain-containing protein n=1 Tax=Psylliodes chrysocephalus TaxID=3402493 RepID=A0A9P0D6N6_9CUCU|nr:unnamed protein product [Psylliodes chrysocephala]